MTRYDNGANLERTGVNILRGSDWPLVMRSAGSHGPVDVMALHSTVRLLIQAKRHVETMPAVDWNRLYQLSLDTDSQPCLLAGTVTYPELWLITGPRKLGGRKPWPMEPASWALKDWMWLA